MSLFRRVHRLLEVPSATVGDQVGPSWLVLPSDADLTPDHALRLRLWVQQPTPVPVQPDPNDDCAPTHSAGRSVPTLAVPVDPDADPTPDPAAEALVIVETSVDRLRWAPVHPPIPVGEVPILSEVVVGAPYLRARTQADGTPHGAAVHLLANGAFKLERLP